MAGQLPRLLEAVQYPLYVKGMVGPFEDLGDVQVTTLPCAVCDEHHDRESYRDTGECFRGAAQHKILECPNGHAVYMIYEELNSGDPVYACTDVLVVPSGAVRFRC